MHLLWRHQPFSLMYIHIFIFCRFINFMSFLPSLCYSNKSYYELGIFEGEWVWLSSQNKRKLSSLYHGPYKVHSCSEQSMIIQKSSGFLKVSIRNVKAYVPRVATFTKTGSYNLRERKFPISYAKVSSSDEAWVFIRRK